MVHVGAVKGEALSKKAIRRGKVWAPLPDLELQRS